MKKIFTFLITFLLPSMTFAAANDYTVRIAVATQETIIACQLRDDLDALAKLEIRRNNFIAAFSDADFTISLLPWVNAYNANGLFDFVNADLQVALTSSNGNNNSRDWQILEQMCGD